MNVSGIDKLFSSKGIKVSETYETEEGIKISNFKGQLLKYYNNNSTISPRAVKPGDEVCFNCVQNGKKHKITYTL